METLKTAMVNFVQTNGGRVTWNALVSAMPGENRRAIPAAFYQLKSAGLLARQNRRVDGVLTLEVYQP